LLQLLRTLQGRAVFVSPVGSSSNMQIPSQNDKNFRVEEENILTLRHWIRNAQK
jgi:hypothetical protein